MNEEKLLKAVRHYSCLGKLTEKDYKYAKTAENALEADAARVIKYLYGVDVYTTGSFHVKFQ